MGNKLTTKEKRKMYRVVNANGDYQQVLPETSAEQVVIDSITGLTATTVQDALSQIKDIADNGGVTGVKGEQESSYRVGDVSVSAENVGAISYAKAQSSLTDAQKAQAKSNIGLSNVANERQYSASNEPPYPVTSVNSKTGAVSLTYSDVGAVEANTAITGATYAKITYDSKGLVTGGADLVASDIPDLSATYAKKTDTDAVATRVSTIEGKIPTQATSSNQLADKDFVNSSINSSSAFYITADADGNPFPTNASLMSATTFYYAGAVRVPTKNDYCLVLSDEVNGKGNDENGGGNGGSCRYMYVGVYGQGGRWEFQYKVNDTPFTQAQLKAINSGVTADWKIAIGNSVQTNTNDVATLKGTSLSGAFKNKDVNDVYDYIQGEVSGGASYPSNDYAKKLAQSIETYVGFGVGVLLGEPDSTSNDLAVAKAKSLRYTQVVGAERTGQPQDIVVNLGDSSSVGTTNVWNIDGKKNHTYTIGAELSDTGVTAGTYGSVTVDAKGRVTAGSNPSVPVAGTDAVGGILSGGDVTVANTGSVTVNKATQLRNSRDFSITGDVTATAVSFNGTGNVALSATLASVGSAGTYTVVTTDAKGRVTAGGNSIEWGTAGNNAPSANLMVGGIFMEYQA